MKKTKYVNMFWTAGSNWKEPRGSFEKTTRSRGINNWRPLDQLWTVGIKSGGGVVADDELTGGSRSGKQGSSPAIGNLSIPGTIGHGKRTGR